MIRSIFLDVDGTLYSHRIHDIPSSALRSLEALRRRGIRIFLATGRHRLALARMNLHGFPFDGYVTLTGHLCYDRAWRPVFRAPLPEADAAALIRAFSGRRFPMLLLQENSEYANFADGRFGDLPEPVPVGPAPPGAIDSEPVYAAAMYAERRDAEAFAAEIPGCRLSAWHASGFDIISRDVGKVRGIKEMLALFGMSREETAVFGDADNDAEMLSFAGAGVAMGNGTPAAKAAADYVTDSVDEDGLEKAFRRLGLLAD